MLLTATNKMNELAEAYVKLVLQIGLYDADYVDAYYGPEEWKPSADDKKEQFPFDELHAEATRLSDLLSKVDIGSVGYREAARQASLTKQLRAVVARIEILNGKKLTFDEESRLLYDAVAPTHSAEYFESLLVKLKLKLPGKGDVAKRLADFKKDFVIPRDKLDAVFKAAIEESRKRTLQYVDLPENESFTVEYVTDKAWSGYNWYKGNSFSLIQVNTDLDIYIDRAVDLAAHEGYPGHHVFNALLEKNLSRALGWVEYSVYPLFSPQSLIAEGSANYGIQMAFPAEERIKFEKEVLFPLAGMDVAKAEEYYEVSSLTDALGYAGNEAARNYLYGKMSADEAADWLSKYSLMSPARAKQRIRFIEKYRSYVINYNLGQDVVKNYVEAGDDAKRWERFIELLSTPQTPSALVAATSKNMN